jgi:hypothetical protein
MILIPISIAIVYLKKRKSKRFESASVNDEVIFYAATNTVFFENLNER